MLDPETILSTLGGAGVGAGGLWGWRRIGSQNKRDDAESAKVLAQAYGLFVDKLQDEMTRLREENGHLRERTASLETQLASLQTQLAILIAKAA